MYLDEYEAKYIEERKNAGKSTLQKFFNKFKRVHDPANEAINDTQESDYGQKNSNTFEKKMIHIKQADQDSVNLKDFNIIERLGKGSFGSVYFVEKVSDKLIHAMKVLEKEKILKQNLVRYAMTERNVLCLAKHPFIVSLNYAF